MINIQQWITAFNIFASVYAERASGDAPKLLKYCEVVCDLSQKSDNISRFQVESFKELAPEADEFPTTVPTNLLPENWSLI